MGILGVWLWEFKGCGYVVGILEVGLCYGYLKGVVMFLYLRGVAMLWVFKGVVMLWVFMVCGYALKCPLHNHIT
jgi:hypothetical protein